MHKPAGEGAGPIRCAQSASQSFGHIAIADSAALHPQRVSTLRHRVRTLRIPIPNRVSVMHCSPMGDRWFSA